MEQDKIKAIIAAASEQLWWKTSYMTETVVTIINNEDWGIHVNFNYPYWTYLSPAWLLSSFQKRITCSLQSHDLWHSQPFSFCWLEKIAESLACFPSKQSSRKFPKPSQLIPAVPAQPNGGSYLFFVQREGALFLPRTLLIFPSLFVTNTPLVLALLQKIVWAKKNWGCLEPCRASILLLRGWAEWLLVIHALFPLQR